MATGDILAIKDRLFTITHVNGDAEQLDYRGQLPADREAALKQMTSYIMAARDPFTWDDNFLFPVSEQERDCAEALELFKRVDNPNYVGPHTEARNLAVDALCSMCPDLFMLAPTVTAEAVTIPDPRPATYDTLPLDQAAA